MRQEFIFHSIPCSFLILYYSTLLYFIPSHSFLLDPQTTSFHFSFSHSFLLDPQTSSFPFHFPTPFYLILRLPLFHFILFLVISILFLIITFQIFALLTVLSQHVHGMSSLLSRAEIQVMEHDEQDTAAYACTGFSTVTHLIVFHIFTLELILIPVELVLHETIVKWLIRVIFDVLYYENCLYTC